MILFILRLLHFIIGTILFMWYSCIRWTVLDGEKYKWVNKPINIITALIAILFLLATLFTDKHTNNVYFVWMAIFLLVRNVYYGFTDMIDLKHAIDDLKPITEIVTLAFFVVLDILMSVYVSVWLFEHRAFLS
jgi:uncharacterized membrane protein